MERRVTVNDRIERVELEVPPELAQDETADEPLRAGSHGPCLYLGPKGQRCSRRASEGGYCTTHQAGGASGIAERSYGRVLTATIAVMLIVWPYISGLVHELIRWLSSAR
jgi:hypothetical protein